MSRGGARAVRGLLLAVGGLLGAGAGVTAAAVSPAVTAAAVSPEIAAARLQGDYSVTGVVTQAVGIAGEHRGEHVQRTWNFISPCDTGACPLLGLHRQRSGGTDPLFLHEIARGTYTGAGIFAAPLRCHGRLYPLGSVVPYTISLRITTAAPQPDGSVHRHRLHRHIPQPGADRPHPLLQRAEL